MALTDAVELGRLLGKSPYSVRACVTRLARDGLLVREHAGRTAYYRLSPKGKALAGGVVERFMRIHAIVESANSWDGTWTLVSFGIPERRRARRDEFRTRLREMGFGQLVGGLWVSPRDASESVKALAASLGIGRNVVIMRAGEIEVGGKPIASVAKKVWPLARLSRAYSAMRTRMKRRIEAMRGRIASGALPRSREAFLEIFNLFNEAAELISQDPCLPKELLPESWLGLEVQDLIHEYFHMIHGLELEDPYSFLLRLPEGLAIPSPKSKVGLTTKAQRHQEAPSPQPSPTGRGQGEGVDTTRSTKRDI